MEEKSRIKLVAGIDLIVAVFILLTGFFVIFFGISWGDFVNAVVSSYSGYPSSINPYLWMDRTTWIVNFIGITAIIYGIKRMIDNISKFFT